ncbi:fructose-6-phosphate aldolase, TalC/MipB family [Marinilactibacillus piezotolerans]|uniref:Fructose-6-phosphate aldolase, TalC/MipB family n=1 Tax=Marinilactibacillus piezotolerans TaxID=258723 RepID=A0A1I4AI09_9LACT|nr:transaldolase family protein [Marinilactibacillus piezotolerans]SFK56095.1 fructose-6-phosphate aldolase, TalC/MipB family [Marinilactibacillus piezotolerans]
MNYSGGYKNIGIFNGITTNPSILFKENIQRENVLKDFSKENINQLFVQITGKSYKEMKADYESIRSSMYFNEKVGIKVPINIEGLKLINHIKQGNTHQIVLGTAIYTSNQGILGAKAGCDYLAFYVNRMELNHIDSYSEIKMTKNYIELNSLKAQIMGASFKNPSQVIKSLDAGADTITISPEIIQAMLSNPLVEEAIDQFEKDSCKLKSK